VPWRRGWREIVEKEDKRGEWEKGDLVVVLFEGIPGSIGGIVCRFSVVNEVGRDAV
jgi:hypothetical protein